MIALRGDLRLAAREADAVRAELIPGPLFPTFTGYLAFKQDLDRILEHDLIRAEAVSLPLALLVLIAVFGSLVAALCRCWSAASRCWAASRRWSR